MAAQRSTSDRIANEIAQATGRSDTEVKLAIGAAVVVTVVAAVGAAIFRILKWVLDMDVRVPGQPGHR